MAKLLKFPADTTKRPSQKGEGGNGLLAAGRGPLLFCNIGWMERYEGLKGRPDKIVGGGKFVDKEGYGAEVCNFLPTNDSFVYGYVETIKGEVDRRIDLSRLGATGDRVEGATVVWTASHPDERGRRVIGWYRGATVFQDRQRFAKYPSPQHRRDRIKDYRVRAPSSGAWLLPVEDRTLCMGRGSGWMGQTPWWVPSVQPSAEIGAFLERLAALLNGWFEEDDSALKSVIERGRFRLHRQRERNPVAARLAKQHHGLRCQACTFDFQQFYGPLGDGFIEAHHL
nr:hypothetical protein [Vicinamibacterales bacterium]